MDTQQRRKEAATRCALKFSFPSATNATLAILISVLLSSASAHSTKGGQHNLQTPQRPTAGSYGVAAAAAAPSPVSQLRQQQQTFKQQPLSTGSSLAGPRANQQQATSYEATTDDPLADSEPALYGSVAGAPGVDFPAYTRIPKTSFTCEGKGFDFGFYADEEAQCQVYHVCWSGRRESFLCGVGTVFNQAILACDYWHSVDCSKSSQFYGVNSELGKAGAEPASNNNNNGNRRSPARTQATLPSSSSSLAGNYGEPLANQRRNQNYQQQQQQQLNNDDQTENPQQVSYATGNQQRISQQVATGVKGAQLPNQNSNLNQQRPNQNTYSQQQQQQQQTNNQPSSFTQQRAKTAYDYNNQPQRSSNQLGDIKGNQAASLRSPPAQLPLASTLATPVAQRPRFNMDFNQKVNSLIESPVRPPIKSAGPPANQPAGIKGRQQDATAQQPIRQQPVNFAQIAVNRAQQSASRNLNLAQNNARQRGSQNTPFQQQKIREPQQQQQQQQQQQLFDNEPELEQQQQFDDSPVQTSTSQTNQPSYGQTNRPTTPIGQISEPAHRFEQVPQQQQLLVRAGGNSLDGSSAITSQYDTFNSPQSSNSDSSYDSTLDESPNGSSLNDDFRSAGAKAAASHNQNWYIMRTI